MQFVWHIIQGTKIKCSSDVCICSTMYPIDLSMNHSNWFQSCRDAFEHIECRLISNIATGSSGGWKSMFYTMLTHACELVLDSRFSPENCLPWEDWIPTRDMGNAKRSSGTRTTTNDEIELLFDLITLFGKFDIDQIKCKIGGSRSSAMAVEPVEWYLQFSLWIEMILGRHRNASTGHSQWVWHFESIWFRTYHYRMNVSNVGWGKKREGRKGREKVESESERVDVFWGLRLIDVGCQAFAEISVSCAYVAHFGGVCALHSAPNFGKTCHQKRPIPTTASICSQSQRFPFWKAVIWLTEGWRMLESK